MSRFEAKDRDAWSRRADHADQTYLSHDGDAITFDPAHSHSTALSGSGGSLAQEVTYISGIEADGTVAAVSNLNWNNDNPATYDPDTSTAHKAGGDTAGSAGTIKYYFDPGSNWTTAEKAAWTSSATLWSWVSNVTFTQVSTLAAATIDIKRDPNEQSGYSTLNGNSAVGGTTIDNTQTGDVVVGPPAYVPIAQGFETLGGYAYTVMVHELGHVLGLGHGGPYNGDVNPATQQYGVYDTTAYSIMSYIAPDDTTAGYFGQYPVQGFDDGSTSDGSPYGATTPMMLDILAAQRLYGMPTQSPLTGGQTFGFHTTLTGSGSEFFNFNVNTTPIVTIFDLGTGNTLDLSGFSQNSTVNLNPGTFSSADGLGDNIAIAMNTIIETGIGGVGNDSFTGSSVNNDLIGGGGNDLLIGNAGNDTLNGGSGNDAMTGGIGNDVYFVDNGNDKITESKSQGSDTVYASASYTLASGQSVEYLGTTSQAGTTSISLTGNSLAQTINGNDGADRLDGYGGGDTMYGHGGNDIFLVRSAADMVFEANGEGGDTIYTTVSYALQSGQSVDTLATASQTATTAMNLTGNNIANHVFGNNGDNVISGGGGVDLLYGYGGNDTIIGGAASDTLDTGNGRDVVAFTAVSDSTGFNHDIVMNMNLAGTDKFDFTVLPDSVHAEVTTGTLNAASFDTNLAAAIHDAGQMGANQAVLFDPSAGDLAGHLFLIVDANSSAGYQAGADYVVELTNPTGTLTIDDFI